MRFPELFNMCWAVTSCTWLWFQQPAQYIKSCCGGKEAEEWANSWSEWPQLMLQPSLWGLDPEQLSASRSRALDAATTEWGANRGNQCLKNPQTSVLTMALITKHNMLLSVSISACYKNSPASSSGLQEDWQRSSPSHQLQRFLPVAFSTHTLIHLTSCLKIERKKPHHRSITAATSIRQGK